MFRKDAWLYRNLVKITFEKIEQAKLFNIHTNIKRMNFQRGHTYPFAAHHRQLIIPLASFSRVEAFIEFEASDTGKKAHKITRERSEASLYNTVLENSRHTEP